MGALIRALIAPGLLASPPVHTAVLVGGAAAVVSAVVGVFAVMRGQAFAGHALTGVSSAGGSLSFLLGIHPLLGFAGMAAIGAGGMEALEARRTRVRGLATGVVLGAGLGLAALFLYFDAVFTSTSGAAVTVLFGSLFAVPASTGWLAAAVGAAALTAVGVLYRPLLLCSLHADLAAARGVRVGLVGAAYAAVLALGVALAAVTVGAVLSTALLVGPAAAGLRLANRPGRALLWAAGIGLGATWAGIVLAFDSATWTPGHGWPVSFFVVALVTAAYGLTSAGHGRAGRGQAAGGPAGGARGRPWRGDGGLGAEGRAPGGRAPEGPAPGGRAPGGEGA